MNDNKIREFIKSQRTKVNSQDYLSPTYEDSDYYRQEGKIFGYEEALDDLEIFLDKEGE